MAAPSKSWTVIPDSAIDLDSPLTDDLMEDIRDNLEHLEEWLGKDYTAAQNHDHDGVNSALISGTGVNIAPIGLLLSNYLGYSTTNASYTLVASTRIFIPGTATEMKIEGYIKNKGTYTTYAYFTLVGGATDTSDTQSNYSVTYTHKTWTATISASNQGQTCVFNLYLKTSTVGLNSEAYWQIHDGTTPANNYSLAGRIT